MLAGTANHLAAQPDMVVMSWKACNVLAGYANVDM